MKKILFTCILFLGLGLATGTAQSDTMKKKAANLVEQMNNDIKAGNVHFALSEKQKEQIYEIHLERLVALRKANKAGANQAERKAINKPYYKKIYSKILTKHQKIARNIGVSRSKT